MTEARKIIDTKPKSKIIILEGRKAQIYNTTFNTVELGSTSLSMPLFLRFPPHILAPAIFKPGRLNFLSEFYPPMGVTMACLWPKRIKSECTQCHSLFLFVYSPPDPACCVYSPVMWLLVFCLDDSCYLWDSQWGRNLIGLAQNETPDWFHT